MRRRATAGDKAVGSKRKKKASTCLTLGSGRAGDGTATSLRVVSQMQKSERSRKSARGVARLRQDVDRRTREPAAVEPAGGEIAWGTDASRGDPNGIGGGRVDFSKKQEKGHRLEMLVRGIDVLLKPGGVCRRKGSRDQSDDDASLSRARALSFFLSLSLCLYLCLPFLANSVERGTLQSGRR